MDVRFGIDEFTPSQALHAGVRCRGVRLQVTDRRVLRPVSAGLHLLAAAIGACGSRFRWMDYPTAANPGGKGHFERLVGQGGLRTVVAQCPADLETQVRSWTLASGWADRVESSLVYGPECGPVREV